ncbi:D-cysteine desulfhydrase 2 [Carex littledalei]|uniref:D-cysteine desulfhydrase 2 n=1 Tax=Carex littledalei TaxID=544730 RepID=A0A833QXA7_9POAL|nr:D-cysteine desulfhydrase 2 [Carex littledalei]
MSIRLARPAALPISATSGDLLHYRSFASLSDLLSTTSWHLPSPFTPIHTITVAPDRGHFSFSKLLDGEEEEETERRISSIARFHVARDDLLHPLANGNKARKLDALLPLLRTYSATDAVTCGGCQSAHAAALALYCAEMHIRPHLLLRGEQPQVPTGYNLISLMFGNVTYASRSVYAQRSQMLHDHAEKVAGPDGLVVWADDITDLKWQELEMSGASRRVVIISEGAASAVALLGVIRLVKFLSESSQFGNGCQVQVIVDAGTGTTAVGIALGALLLGLPWKVTGVMLADTMEAYKEREKTLITEFKRVYKLDFPAQESYYATEGILNWVERSQPRKFGKVLNGEIERCCKIAQQTAVPLDPIYTLAAWDLAVSLSLDKQMDTKVLMVHTGGTLGMFGLAQMYSSSFVSHHDLINQHC